MSFSLDARIPVIFGIQAAAGPQDALLLEGQGAPTTGRDYFQPEPPATHPANCACCPPRNSAGMALARLMLARGRGTGLFFNRVIAVTTTDQGKAAINTALNDDPIASSFYKGGSAAP
jgi:hypothetical protein